MEVWTERHDGGRGIAIGRRMVVPAIAVPLAVGLIACSMPVMTEAGREPGDDAQRTRLEGHDVAEHASDSLYALLAEGDEDMERLDRGFADGTGIPKMLAYDTSESWGEYAVTDEGLIRDAWEWLMDARIGEPTDEHVELLDGDIRFVFVWNDGTRVAISFLGDEWYQRTDGDGIETRPVKTPEAISAAYRMCEQNARPMREVDPDYDPFPHGDAGAVDEADSAEGRAYGDG